ncbi:methyltransferase domain-containing protein [Streptomyces nogalater]
MSVPPPSSCPRLASRTDRRRLGPLGTGLGANRLLLLDAARRPVPAGVPGELYIAGPGVTRGYLGRDELTAERFLPDEAVPGGRIYRTGDMALLDGDGLPVFLYRTDEQTKIRGFRVEPAAVRARLAEHQAVEQAVVVARELADGDTGLVAYAVPTAAYCATLSPVLDRQQVGEWTEVFENVYDAGTSGDTLLDLTGWNSSYTGEEMTEQEIRESVDGIVGRVTALAPQSVLEVGCGTGLLLYRLAPGTRRYVGTDFSAEVLATLARTVEADPERFAPVSLQCREAADFRGFDDDSFDLVLLNSVVQYFPSAAYLRQVIGEAVRVVRPGGHVFVGDVRDLRLLEAFQLSVGIHQADDTATAGELLRQAAAAAEDEGELLLTRLLRRTERRTGRGGGAGGAAQARSCRQRAVEVPFRRAAEGRRPVRSARGRAAQPRRADPGGTRGTARRRRALAPAAGRARRPHRTGRGAVARGTRGC